ncbi:MAG: TIGR03936 family radical SAM-associated protein [Planctomycetota bacterium]|jgi:radical SAM-linked protein
MTPTPEPDWKRVRLVFSKQGRLRFLGQLDLGRTFDRSLRRTGLPIRYTDGYHPKVKLSFPCASPTGMASTCEILEVQVAATAGAEDLAQALSADFAEGLDIVSTEEVPTGQRLRLRAATYVVVPGEEDAPGFEDADAAELRSREHVEVERRGRTVDLVPFMDDIAVRDGELHLRLLFMESGATVRPDDVLGAMGRDALAYRSQRTSMTVTLRKAGVEEERTYGA